jgi:4-oxalocrotonate tautomerase
VPLVRIDLVKGKDAAYRSRLSEVIYEAMLATIGMPKNDRFQLITEHERQNFVYDRSYLGVERSDDLIIIQITLNEGRTVAQKQALYKAVADALNASLGLRRQDVLVNLIEVKKENWSFGDGLAQYVQDVPPASR